MGGGAATQPELQTQARRVKVTEQKSPTVGSTKGGPLPDRELIGGSEGPPVSVEAPLKPVCLRADGRHLARHQHPPLFVL